MRRSDSGFTLLEVLGAVALLAFVYTTLSTVAIRGLRSEGESRRLLEASLRVDEALADIEFQIAQGLVPELGSEETEEERFVIRMNVEIFQPSFGASASPGASSGTASAAPASPQSVLSGPDSPVREITVSVLWSEGFDQREVTRTTYAIDPIAAEAAAQALGAGTEGISAGTGSGTRSDTGTDAGRGADGGASAPGSVPPSVEQRP
jgi:hypothetical protein